jgi:hypothetical protein
MIKFQPQTVPQRSGTVSSNMSLSEFRRIAASVDYRRIVESWVVEHPAMSLGVALIAGAGVGWLVKRR